MNKLAIIQEHNGFNPTVLLLFENIVRLMRNCVATKIADF